MRRVALAALTLALFASLLSACSGSAASSSRSGTVGDLARGREVFTTNCATCHGATGAEGGVGPSLRNERVRKGYDATIAWIENPQPPMPKLYPSPLDEREVQDAAAYVQSL